MAIDSRDKRFSMLGGHRKRIMPNPDGDFANVGDRQHLLGFYRGIQFSEPVWIDVIFRGVDYITGEHIYMKGQYKVI